jgi:SAM-dependent methyltransferase
MDDWSAGYVTDVGYTFGYYPELNPLRVRLAFLGAGIAPPASATACELGFGQGLSVNLHAAATGTHWYGTDFNPAHARYAQELSRVSGAAANLCDQSFAEFCGRADLPDFDYIGVHGIWSWVSDENRALIVDFLRRKLKTGGVLYISYNCQPGWALMVPVRELLVEHHARMSAPGLGTVPRIDAALAFADKLFATNPIYARANPQLAERLKKLKGHNRSYLAHEYFNRDHVPMSFAQMAPMLAAAKLTYACSAHYLDHVGEINLSLEQRVLLKEIPDPVFRELVRDFCVSQTFRRDYWVKGPRRLPALEKVGALRGERVLLTKPRAEVSLKVAGSLGEATMQEAVYGPVLDALADLEPKSLAQLEQAVAGKGITLEVIVQVLITLIGTGTAVPAQDDAIIAAARPGTDRLNAHLCAKARGAGDINYLASPVTAGGMAVGRFGQIFLLARAQGATSPAEWARFAWQLLAAQGHKIIKDGKTLQSPEENLAELTNEAQKFADQTLPVLKAMAIA